MESKDRTIRNNQRHAAAVRAAAPLEKTEHADRQR
jgi:hypothetical protein